MQFAATCTKSEFPYSCEAVPDPVPHWLEPPASAEHRMLSLRVSLGEVLMAKEQWRMLLLASFAGCLAIWILWGWALLTF